MSLFADLISSRRLMSLPDDFFSNASDMHSHILPGVDDGISNADESRKALAYLSDLGFSHVVLTPHVMADYGRNRRESLSKCFQDFKKATSPLPVSVSLAAEYMIDDKFESHSEDGYLTFGTTKYLLTETSYVDIHHDHSQMLYQLSLEDYKPIIAHPERYNYASYNQYEYWKRRDYFFQLNLLSLAGAYGETAEKKALRLLNEGLYDFVGTDLHKLEAFQYWLPKIRLKSKQIDQLHELLEHNYELVV